MGADDKKRKEAELSKKVTTLFGVEDKVIVPTLRDRYAHPPFNVFLTGNGDWQKRQKSWRKFLQVGDVGIQAGAIEKVNQNENYISAKGIGGVKIADEAIFDPFLLEILADLYCPIGGKIIDTFNGSHISAGVFNQLSRDLKCHYTGIDIRPKIIEQSKEKLISIFGENHEQNYNFICGDSDYVLDDLVFEEYDWYNSCPPYTYLVKYTKGNPIKGDLSMLDYDSFVIKYRSIIKKTCDLLKVGSYATYTIGQVRDKDGSLLPFKEDTISAFKDSGLAFWNEIQMVGVFGSAGIRAENTFGRGNKGQLVNCHQNVLVFKKL